MVTAREREELKSFTVMARRCTVPLIEQNDHTAEILGTGTLFAANSKHYLITAAHVVADHLHHHSTERIGVPLGVEHAPVARLGNVFVSHYENTDVFDVAIVRLDQPELVSALNRFWKFLTTDNIAGVPFGCGKAFVAGYPCATSRTGTNFKISSRFTSFATALVDQAPEDATAVQPGIDVFLGHKESGTGLDEKSIELPNLKGLSGASVWSMVGRNIAGRTEDQARVIAVEVACREGSYIRAKSWVLVAKLFEALDLQAAAEIKRAVGWADEPGSR